MSTVVERLLQVMEEIGAVGKNARNVQQGYAFRSADDVVNAVAPLLRKHGVLPVPVAQDLATEHYTSTGGASMKSATVTMRYRFVGNGGPDDFVEAVVYGESADAGDKSVSKSQTVAYRIALCQVLCIPTGDADPDMQANERRPQQQARPRKAAAAKKASAPNRPENTPAWVPEDQRPAKALVLARQIAKSRGVEPPTALDQVDEAMAGEVVKLLTAVKS